MLSEGNMLLKFDQHVKSDKLPFFIDAYLETSIKKTDGCKTSPEKLSTTKVCEHILCSF